MSKSKQLPKYRVQCCTYNGHLGGATNEDSLTSWLIPTLKEGSSDYLDEGPCDIVAIGFQEMIPLHLSLLGLTGTALDLHDHKLKAAIEAHASVTGEGGEEKESYTLMSKKVLGGIALLVYTRDRTLTSKVSDVRVATAATGILNVMGNKGGVGVRLTVQEEDNYEDSKEDTGDLAFTFVTAHLAAHDSGLQRRNQDWKSIVERLVFTEDGPSYHYRPSKVRDVFRKLKKGAVVGSEGIQIFDSSYLFFFGDLNYRIDTKKPKPLALHLISHKMINDLPSLLLQDQLATEKNAGRTLHNLREGQITFTPTYKYKPGTVSEFKKFTKRVPGWCDRILFTTWADGEDGAGTIKKVGADGEEKVTKRKGAKVDLYRSVMQFTASDHKPVTAIISLSRQPKGTHALRIPFASPFPIDPLWRRKQLYGFILDHIVGFFWTIVMIAGFGKDARLGATTLLTAAVSAWYYRTMLFGM